MLIHKVVQFCREHVSEGQNQSGNTTTGLHKDEKSTAFAFVNFGVSVLVERYGGYKGQSCVKKIRVCSDKIIAAICSMLPNSSCFKEAACLQVQEPKARAHVLDRPNPSNSPKQQHH